jgi:uncharacterized membrane protein
MNLSLNQYKNITICLSFLLIITKFLIYMTGRITLLTFIIWSMPIIIFIARAAINSAKSYQVFCFILLIYFLFVSLRVFGMTFFYMDVVELILIIYLFIHCLFGPKKINFVK